MVPHTIQAWKLRPFESVAGAILTSTFGTSAACGAGRRGWEVMSFAVPQLKGLATILESQRPGDPMREDCTNRAPRRPGGVPQPLLRRHSSLGPLVGHSHGRSSIQRGFDTLSRWHPIDGGGSLRIALEKDARTARCLLSTTEYGRGATAQQPAPQPQCALTEMAGTQLCAMDVCWLPKRPLDTL